MNKNKCLGFGGFNFKQSKSILMLLDGRLKRLLKNGKNDKEDKF